MKNCLQELPVPDLRRIGAGWGIECARIHAASFSFPWPSSDFERLLAAPEACAAGAVDRDGTNLAGFVLSRFAADEAELLTIAVAPERRRSGIGKSLVAAHMAGLASIGVRHLFLEVDVDNPAARALYAGLGFRNVGERKAYYQTGNAERGCAIVMRADLS